MTRRSALIRAARRFLPVSTGRAKQRATRCQLGGDPFGGIGDAIDDCFHQQAKAS
jgi:hypothetical protein